MKDLSDITVCVVDSGLFFQAARRMAEECRQVIYWSPDCRGFKSLRQGVIGYGFEKIRRVKEFYPFLDEIDLFLFPDSDLAGLQGHLSNLGKLVWGSRRGQVFEQDRQLFLETLAEIGLEVPPHHVCHGLDELRDYLKDREDKYIKISYWRGDMETFHWRNWKMDEGHLDWLAVRFGPFKRDIDFLVFDKIETDLELGGDLYSIDGALPSLMLNGIEGKDKSYLAAVTKAEHMPEEIKGVIEAFRPKLVQTNYRNQLSLEVRVKGDTSWWIDATQRGGMPSSNSQWLLWKNWPQIVWHGANGILLEPEPAAEFSIEVMITSKGGDGETWDVAEVPAEIERWCRFSNCAYRDGCYVFPPDDIRSQDLGWLAAIGNTPREVLDAAKEHADLLPDGLNADVEALADVIKEVESAMEQGIPFTDEEMPKPAEVLE